MSKKRTSTARPLRSGPGYKGAYMPSFAKQDERNTNKKDYSFIPNAHSLAQQKRNLRNRCRVILDSSDQEVAAAGARVIQSCANDPDPEYSALHLFAAALDAAEQTGSTWLEAIAHFMDHFDQKLTSTRDVEVTYEDDEHGKTEEADRNPSRLRRLLRAIIPRRPRARHEAVTETSVNQPTGAGDAQCGSTSRSDTAQADRGSRSTDDSENHA